MQNAEVTDLQRVYRKRRRGIRRDDVWWDNPGKSLSRHPVSSLYPVQCLLSRPSFISPSVLSSLVLVQRWSRYNMTTPGRGEPLRNL